MATKSEHKNSFLSKMVKTYDQLKNFQEFIMNTQQLKWFNYAYWQMEYASLQNIGGRRYTYFINIMENGTFWLHLVAYQPVNEELPRLSEIFKTIEEAKEDANLHYQKYLNIYNICTNANDTYTSD